MRKWDIEVSLEMYEVLSKIFHLMGLEVPEKMTSQEMENVYEKMHNVFRSRNLDLNKAQIPSLSDDDFTVIGDKIKPITKIKNSLIISKMGIIRYQLKSLLTGAKVDVSTVDDQYRGLAEYVKKLHDLVVLDLAGEIEEIFDVLKEINRISLANAVNTKVVVLVSPENKELQNNLENKGVDNIFIKEGNWYELLKNIIKINETGLSNT